LGLASTEGLGLAELARALDSDDSIYCARPPFGRPPSINPRRHYGQFPLIWLSRRIQPRLAVILDNKSSIGGGNNLGSEFVGLANFSIPLSIELKYQVLSILAEHEADTRIFFRAGLRSACVV